MTKRKITTLATIAVVLGYWINSRWDVWFGNPPEPAYTTLAAPHRVMLTMGNHGENNRLITWQTNTTTKEGKWWLEFEYESEYKYGTASGIYSPDRNEVKTRGGKIAFYSVDLRDLIDRVGKDNGKNLKYIISTENDTIGPFSIDLPEKGSTTSFVFMGDVQDTAKGQSHDIFKAIDHRHPDARFWLFGGDLAERPMDKWWETVFEDLDSIATRKPILSIPGNHEYLKGLVKKLDPRLTETFAYYKHMNGRNVFTFKQGDARFFLLDSNADFWKLYSQRSWLKEELRKCTEKWKIVVLHHPLHSNKGEHYNPLVKMAFGDIVKDYGVDLVLQGHEHVYARWNEKDEAGNHLSPMYLSSVCSPKLYQLHFSEPEDRIGTNDRFYQNISYNADSLVVWTYTTSDMKPYDHICITKKQDEGYKVTDYFKNEPQKVEVSDWFRKTKGRHVKEYEEEIARFKESSKNSR